MKRTEIPRVPCLRPLCACLALLLAGSAPAFASAAFESRHAGEPLSLLRAEALGAFAPRWLAALPGGAPDRPLQARPAIVVQNCDDSGPGSLRDAYFNAIDGDVIDLGELTCSTITLTSGALTDSPSAAAVTLNGPGKYDLTIDGNHAGRVLVHNGSGALTLNNLRITNGSYSGSYGGGCIYSYGRVTVQAAIVSACSMSSSGTAKAYGGAIYARDAVIVIGSTVSDSSAHAASANSAGGGIWANRVNFVFSTISGNSVSGDGSHYARGGGAFVLGDAQIAYSTISGNQADSGAGAFFVGAATYPMQLLDSTISGNHASGAGGGLYAKYRPLQVFNSTIAQNTAGFEFGAGLYLASATELESTIVANNTSQDGLYASDIGGPATTTLTGANNLIVASTLSVPADTIAAAPMLGPLQDNGGLTHTQALLPGSPAIDHGSNVVGILHDQRAVDLQTNQLYERVVGPSADIGAFEFGAPDRIFIDGFEQVVTISGE